jgi:CBS domain containing-hemolysin-like protein
MIENLIAIVFFLVLEAFFSGSELALFSVNKTKLKFRAKEGDERAKKVYEALEKHFDEYVATTLIGTTISIVSITAFFVSFLHDLSIYVPFLKSKEELFAESIIFITLLFGEIIPKSVFQHYADKLIYFIIPVLEFFRKLFRPFIWLAKLITKLVFIIFKIDGKEKKVLSREDIIDILSYEVEGFQELERKILINILLFHERRLSDIVIPLSEVVAVEKNTPVIEVIRIIKETGYSRIPIFAERLDEIVMIVNAFDLKSANPEDKVEKYAKPIKFVPEFASLPNVLREFKNSKDKIEPMFVVVDERGTIMGIITFEDVIEAILGDIRDEFSKGKKDKQLIIKEKFPIEVDGRISITEVEKLTRVKLPKGSYQTIAGLIIYFLGRMPRKMESITVNNLKIVAKDVDKKRVRIVEIDKVKEKKEESEE